MSKHTPGPWRIDECSHTDRRTIQSDRIGLIAVLAEHDVGQKEWEQDDANGHLIVLSPEMYDALVDIANGNVPDDVAAEGDESPEAIDAILVWSQQRAAQLLAKLSTPVTGTTMKKPAPKTWAEAFRQL